MVKQTVNNEQTQLQMAEFLLDAGAYVDVRDKAGLAPLDYAVMNNNVELVKLLLDYGASVRRENFTFAIPRPTILDKVKDAEVYVLMQARLKEELEKNKIYLAKKALLAKKATGERNREVLRLEHIRKVEEKREKVISNRADKLRKQIHDAKMEELAKKLKSDQALARIQTKHRVGEWERDEHHHWYWKDKKEPHKPNIDYVYQESMKVVKDVRDRRSLRTMRRRWGEFSRSKLEVNWESMKAFEEIAEEEEAKRVQEEADAAFVSNALGNAGDAIVTDLTPVLSFDYRDENDDELDGQDLSDLLI